ncbi:MAG TPA: F0F1 ATP synthase subunit B [Stackebrandtia sp.]|uniref:F0F1 ATP synthase subunit B n=1 Tax=Stackebrandtia sp. TaxID=2023065 RepID=UPI002D3E0E73|nr:F0F1 ATP synthase subunit B [Stackebrandtia sp.]HZE39192.1 F0F1 ATP synthase subunit B [Stackebrandtia sp.]
MKHLSILAEEAPNPIVPVWQEIVIGVIAFAVLCFILMKYVFPKMEQTFRARVDAIEGGIKRAEETQAEANRLLEQYKQQLTEARSEAAGIRDEARAEAIAAKDDILAEAREESDRIIAAGRDTLAASRQQLLTELRGEVGEIAVELAGRIVGESLADEARRSGTVERFLTDLDAESAGSR